MLFKNTTREFVKIKAARAKHGKLFFAAICLLAVLTIASYNDTDNFDGQGIIGGGFPDDGAFPVKTFTLIGQVWEANIETLSFTRFTDSIEVEAWVGYLNYDTYNFVSEKISDGNITNGQLSINIGTPSAKALDENGITILDFEAGSYELIRAYEFGYPLENVRFIFTDKAQSYRDGGNPVNLKAGWNAVHYKVEDLDSPLIMAIANPVHLRWVLINYDYEYED